MLEAIYSVEMKLLKYRKLLAVYYIFFRFFLNVFYKKYLQISSVFRRKRGTEKRSEEIIVSLTSFPARIKTTKICLETIMRQKEKPTRIILWLAKSQFRNKEAVTKQFKNLIKRGLEIRFCDDLRSHKKYYYAFLEIRDAVIITLDDDVYYPKYTLEKLISEYNINPNCVIANIAKNIKKENGKIQPYNEWEEVKERCVSESICPIGVGGVLYPPKSLNAEVLNIKSICELCWNTDDLWLNAMARINHTKIICTGHFPILFCIGNSQKENLGSKNCGEQRNDIELENIRKRYPKAF